MPKKSNILELDLNDCPMDLLEKVRIAFQLLESAEIVEEHPDHLWLQVDKDQYEEFFEPLRFLNIH